jgi:hypothetical protein
MKITLAIITLCGIATICQAQLIQSFTGGDPLTVGPGTAGFEFTVGAQPLTIRTLGLFDEFTDGVLSSSHNVGLWNATTKALVAAATVTPQAALQGGFFWTQLAAPVTLQAGTSYRIGAQYADIDFDLARGNVPSVTADSRITLKDAYLSTGSGFGFPDVNVGGANRGFFGPNAGFAPVPEPSTCATVGIGLLLGAVAWRRWKVLAVVAVATAGLGAEAAQPKLTTLKASISQYPLANYPGGSNAVITIYKSTKLGTVWSPFKPTSIFPASRTNTFIQVIAPNTYRFYATASMQPFGESVPSGIVTNVVTVP